MLFQLIVFSVYIDNLFIIISREMLNLIVNVLFSVVMETCMPLLFLASKV